jgi:hypothetical protein
LLSITRPIMPTRRPSAVTTAPPSAPGLLVIASYSQASASYGKSCTPRRASIRMRSDSTPTFTLKGSGPSATLKALLMARIQSPVSAAGGSRQVEVVGRFGVDFQ